MDFFLGFFFMVIFQEFFLFMDIFQVFFLFMDYILDYIFNTFFVDFNFFLFLSQNFNILINFQEDVSKIKLNFFLLIIHLFKWQNLNFTCYFINHWFFDLETNCLKITSCGVVLIFFYLLYYLLHYNQ